MAPDAKLIFHDIHIGGTDDDLTPPDDLEGLFLAPYQQGARVRSESWGGDSNSYTTTAKEVDSFSRAYRSFLSIWAAGNQGDQGFFTIGSPATAKNILCVGAQLNSWESDVQLDGTSVHLLITISGSSQRQQIPASWATFGTEKYFTGAIVPASPWDACSPISGEILRGKVAVVQVQLHALLFPLHPIPVLDLLH